MRRIRIMNETIPYGKILNQMEAKRLIIFEDDFNKLKEKKALLYGLSRMDEEDQRGLLDTVKAIDSSAFDQLVTFVETFKKTVEPNISSWQDQIVENDIVTSFPLASDYDSIVKLYDEVDNNKWPERDKIYNAFYRYAVGVEVSEAYSSLFDEYSNEKGRRGPIQIFYDYSADSEKEFLQEVEAKNDKAGTTVCIIDDMLQGSPNAESIIQSIREKFAHRRTNIVGVIYSSREGFDSISDNVYFERINKGTKEAKMKAALARSAYSYLLAELSETYKTALNDAFAEAVKSKNIAFYLSNMATAEGETSYNVVTDWINQIYRFRLSKSPKIISIAKLTRLIPLLEDYTVEFDKKMNDLNSFEAFDYNVNLYREPIAPGDIFLSHDKKLYIMVGQACDTMFRNAKEGCKSGVLELVNAELKNIKSTDISVKLKSDYIWISNFKHESSSGVEYKALKVRYTGKGLIDNQILQLCQFNDDGECAVYFTESEYKEKGVEPTYYVELYSRLYEYFSSLTKLKQVDNDLFSTVLENELSKRIINVGKWTEINGGITYGIRRIGRLRSPYILYLNKMFLEYQGRHPFNCINMTRVQRVDIPVEGTTECLHINVVLSPDRSTNKENIELLTWVIDKQELAELVERKEGKQFTFDSEDENIVIDENKKEIIERDKEGKNEKLILSKDCHGKLKISVEEI